MARKKRFIPTPPAILKLPPNKPHRIERGVVVKVRDSQGHVTNRRGIVMGKTPADDFTRAYGVEYYVCEVTPIAGAEMIVRDAKKRRDPIEIKRVVEESTYVFEKNATMLKPVGRVKKIPQLCTMAMKIEKGKL